MKEFHAYPNNDGTYRVETTVNTSCDGEVVECDVTYPRVQLTVNILTDLTSNELCIFEVKGS